MTDALLTPCGRCHRHVRAFDAACPFCGAAPEGPVAEPRRVRRADGRAAILFGAALGLSACGGGGADEGSNGDDTSGGDVSVAPAYGVAPDPEPAPAPEPEPEREDDARVVPLYGGPAPARLLV